jgi:putative acetyltransferase
LDIQIRPATAADIPAICQIHRAAFDGPIEARIVELLHERGKAPISLVASVNDRPVGHVLFSPIEFAAPLASVRCLGLAPIGVLPEHQRQGIGSKLINVGLSQCRDMRVAAVFVLGDANYYSRFGFVHATTFGVGNEYNADEHFMALELIPGSLASVHGVAKYAPEFAEAGC